MPWQRYYELEKLCHLKNEGRELIGEHISITEKRDGENVSLTIELPKALGLGWTECIHSHNLDIASPDIMNRFRATPEYQKAVQLLLDETNCQEHYILYGELMKTVCPTRIEPNKKHCHWVLFDIYDIAQGKYLSYTQVYQKAYHYKIPVVKELDFFIPSSMEEINNKVSEWLKWCRRHHREGIVGKAYRTQVFFKEKIDLPEKVKLIKPDRLTYPEMPQERIDRAIQHAKDIVGEAEWKNANIAMPIVAQQLAVEGREHNYSPPKNMYIIWCNSKW